MTNTKYTLEERASLHTIRPAEEGETSRTEKIGRANIKYTVFDTQAEACSASANIWAKKGFKNWK